MTIYGWDASDFDWDRGPMDVKAAYNDGISFFTHKATESTNVQHVHFGEAMRRARDAGIRFLGAYHVVRSPRNAQAEVDYCLSYVDRSFPEWRTHPGFFIQVDLEKWPYDSVPAIEGMDFANLAQAQSGKVAVIYASKGQYGDELAGTSHELWNANYPLNYQPGPYRDLYRRAGGDSGAGWSSYSGRIPKIWQFTSSAVIGSQLTCDANAFRGSEADFAAMIGADMGGEVADFAASHVPDGAGGVMGMHIAVASLLAAAQDERVRDAAEATAVAGLRAAIDALAAAIHAGGGSVDVAAITARVDAATGEVKALIVQQHAVEVAGLQAQLAALRPAAG